MNEDPPVWKAGLGSLMAMGFSAGLYQILRFLLEHLPPIDPTASLVIRNISIVIRYLITGSLSLVMFTCAMVGLGLLAYSGQLLWQRLRP
ncbi:MAG: DUF3082 domain-containing protein [Thermostichales cyanobacterium SZTDM-1c_bins_54]